MKYCFTFLLVFLCLINGPLVSYGTPCQSKAGSAVRDTTGDAAKSKRARSRKPVYVDVNLGDRDKFQRQLDIDLKRVARYGGLYASTCY